MNIRPSIVNGLVHSVIRSVGAARTWKRKLRLIGYRSVIVRDSHDGELYTTPEGKAILQALLHAVALIGGPVSDTFLRRHHETLMAFDAARRLGLDDKTLKEFLKAAPCRKQRR